MFRSRVAVLLKLGNATYNNRVVNRSFCSNVQKLIKADIKDIPLQLKTLKEQNAITVPVLKAAMDKYLSAQKYSDVLFLAKWGLADDVLANDAGISGVQFRKAQAAAYLGKNPEALSTTTSENHQVKALLKAYWKTKQPELIINAFRSSSSTMTPEQKDDPTCLAYLFLALGAQNQKSKLLKLYQHWKPKLGQNEFLHSCIMSSLLKNKLALEAVNFFKLYYDDDDGNTVIPNIVASVAINAYRQLKMPKECLTLLLKMIKQHSSPDAKTFYVVLHCLSESKEVDKLRLVYETLLPHDIKTSDLHCALLYYRALPPSLIDVSNLTKMIKSECDCNAVITLLCDKNLSPVQTFEIGKSLGYYNKTSSSNNSLEFNRKKRQLVLDLHFLPIAVARAATEYALQVNASLLRSKVLNPKLNASLVIITGKGRGSKSLAPTLGPALRRFLKTEIGLAAVVDSDNTGVIVVTNEALRKYFIYQD